ncbi:uncharacterized protein LOC111900860 [Lactuca sativa]|uniref:uncharacterized protein LOC111900860 n=1 Tax=Lactuca sativa TaxID=4236 RepID=UPI000CD91FF3|nr:uncharacterized protein LOC111900860 [Lactuca sativa]XP_023752509.1 uncharacterized protein LOC111900860 [Lactuca sativa]
MDIFYPFTHSLLPSNGFNIAYFLYQLNTTSAYNVVSRLFRLIPFTNFDRLSSFDFVFSIVILLPSVSASNQIFTGRLSTTFSFFNLTKRDYIRISISSVKSYRWKGQRERQLPILKYAEEDVGEFLQ